MDRLPPWRGGDREVALDDEGLVAAEEDGLVPVVHGRDGGSHDAGSLGDVGDVVSPDLGVLQDAADVVRALQARLSRARDLDAALRRVRQRLLRHLGRVGSFSIEKEKLLEFWA